MTLANGMKSTGGGSNNFLSFVLSGISNHLLSELDPNEAYCIAEEGKQYALYFPDGGEVIIDLSDVEGDLEIRWMNISYSSWLEPITINANGQAMIMTPDRGQWAVLIKPI